MDFQNGLGFGKNLKRFGPLEADYPDDLALDFQNGHCPARFRV